MGTVGVCGDIVGIWKTDWDAQNEIEQMTRDAQSKFEALYPDGDSSSPAEESSGTEH
jgi:hypothetical protein